MNLENLVSSPAAWSEFAVADATRPHLEDILSDLMKFGNGDPVWMARAGHVLMMLGRPREACGLLEVYSHRLARAQAMLAQVQIARKERSFVLLGKIVSHGKHFGTASNPLELEAQMRLDFALGCAFDLLQIADQRDLHYERTLFTAHLIGVNTMPGVIHAMSSVAKSEANPEAHAKRLGLLAVEQAATGNAMMGIDLARQSVELLMRLGDYPSIVDLAPRWSAFLPESPDWTYAARIILDPFLPVPDWGLDVLRHPLPLLAHTRQKLTLALRLAERLHHDEARSLAISALRNPAWPSGSARGDSEMALHITRLLCHVTAGNNASVYNLLLELVRDEWQHVGTVCPLMVGMASLEVYSRGLPEVPGLNAAQATTLTLKGMSRINLAHLAYILSVMTSYTPSAMAFLAQTNEDARQAMSTSAIYVEPDLRVKFNGKTIKGFPHRAYDLVRKLVDEERSSDPRRYVTATRVSGALDTVPMVPVAYAWRVQCLNDLT